MWAFTIFGTVCKFVSPQYVFHVLLTLRFCFTAVHCLRRSRQTPWFYSDYILFGSCQLGMLAVGLLERKRLLAARLHRMIGSAWYWYERRLALTSSNSSKPPFTYVRYGRELQQEVVNGVKLNQPVEICEVFRSNFSSTFWNDEGHDPQSTCIRNTSKSEGAGELHPKIIVSLACYLTAPLAKRFLITRAKLAQLQQSGNHHKFVQSTKTGSKNKVQTIVLLA